MSTRNQKPSIDVDFALFEVFGVDDTGLERAQTVTGHLPNALFSKFLWVIDSSGAVDLLEQWRQEDRKANSGRPELVPLKAVLMVFLLNAFWNKNYSFNATAKTVAYGLTAEQRSRLGISGSGERSSEWYHRFWRSTQRMRQLFNPWHRTSLNSKLSGARTDRANERYDRTREARAHQLAEVLVQASLKLLPRKYLKDYRGDLALDSTVLYVQGRTNPNDKKGAPTRDRLNVDYQCGWYTRHDDHDGTKVAKSKAAYELDTTVLIDTKNGSFDFPLITGINLHRPGEIKQGPRHTIAQHTAFTEKRGLVVVDRAFNNLKSWHFQEHVRIAQLETVYDYKNTQLGQQAKVPGHPVIVVDGALYVDRMPENHRQISRWVAEKKINPATNLPYTIEDRDNIIRARERYLMKRHSRVNADGHQRFTYPDPATYLAFDPATGKKTKDKPIGTIQIDLDPEVIRHLQRYPWKSKDWYRAYGQRNQVETSNKTLKDAWATNLGDKKSRTGRGYAYTYLVAALAVVATNIQRIITGIKNLAVKASGKKRRVSRRKNSSGQPLRRPYEHDLATTIDEESPPGRTS